jgi:hypothetical protein
MSARHIMFFVDRPAGLERGVLQKVAQLARGLDAEVEVFDCIFDPTITDCEKVQRDVDARGAELGTVVEFLQDLSVHSRVTVHWAYPPRDGVLWQIHKQPPDLLVIQSSDYKLIKRAPCSLWVIRNAGHYEGGRVITAADPQSSDDPRVVAFASEVSRAMDMPLPEAGHEASSSDLLVIGAVSRSAFRKARISHCDLLIVKVAAEVPVDPRIHLQGLRLATKAGSRGDEIIRTSQKWSTGP